MIAVDKRIDIFIEYVENHLGEPIPNAEVIAQAIHVSRSTLFRMVERELGMSPFQYIRQEKLNRALELYESGTCDSIRDIAEAVGYIRADYFAGVFKTTFGINLRDVFK